MVSTLHLLCRKEKRLLTSIREHGLLVVEETAITGKHQDSSCHVAIVTATASRVADLHRKLRLVGLIGLASGHLRREDTGCDCVDADLAVLESSSQHAAEVGACCLGRSICELTIARSFHLAADRADVDDL